jgi:DNA-binding helix-hairpin-helix protein with protein kinase domain
MTALPKSVTTSLGQTIRLGRQLGKGGEGAVFEAQDRKDIAVKLYWPTKAASRREKIGAMVAAGWHKANSFVAYPADVLFGPNGTFAGFTMKKVGGYKPVHLLYSPASRKVQFLGASFPFLVRAAINAARAVASVHASSCVIGDINHSGFLVSDKATVTLIDSDSFQVAAAGKNFLCHVGTPDYTPPELQGAKFDQVRRNINHDNFGLAVLIFQLLCMGRHPYSGRYMGKGDMPLERAIKEFRFAYSQQPFEMQPPPAAPLLTDFPDYIAKAFEAAFGREGLQGRPSAEDWVMLLGSLESELERCSIRPHHHVRGRPCPWCRMEQAFPGFLAFSSGHTGQPIPTYIIDTGQFAALINAIVDPGAPPDINSILQQFSAGKHNQTASAAIKQQYGISIAAASGGLLLAQIGFSGWASLFLFGIGFFTAFAPNTERTKAIEQKRQAHEHWRNAKSVWDQQTGNQKFLEQKYDAQECLKQLGGIPAEERRELQALENKKRELQLNRFLDQFLIADAKIKKIGSGRKAVLASFGIETAADVDLYQLQRIQGFGPTLISTIVAWRRTLEGRFVFNPNEPVSQSDIVAVRTKIAARKSSIEQKLRSAITNLKIASSDAFDKRGALSASVNAAYQRLKSAEELEANTFPTLTKTAKVISVVFALISFMAPGALQSPALRATTLNPSGLNRTADTRSSVQRQQPQPPATTTVRKTVPVPVPKSHDPPPAQKLAEGQAKVAPPNDRIKIAEGGNAGSPVAPPLPPATEIPSAVELDNRNTETPESAASNVPKLTLGNTPDINTVQNRLFELGYLPTPPDGKWGPQSRQALREFKSTNGLSANDDYDGATETRLFAESARRPAGPLYVGEWTPEVGACQGESGAPPLRITRERADAGGSYCLFSSIRPGSSNSWRVAARCFVQGETWSTTIHLSVQNNRLRWSSTRGSADYYRCGN